MKFISSTKSNDRCEYVFHMTSESEQVLSSIVNSVLDIGNFAIGLDTYTVQFNLSGKYFELPLENIPDWTDVFVLLDTSYFDDGSIDTSLSKSVVIATPKNIDNASLHLLHREEMWKIPEESFIQSKIPKPINIDDGTL